MTEHEGLPVAGYVPQSDEKIALVNGFKQDEERLLRKIDAIGELRNDPVEPNRVTDSYMWLSGPTPVYDQRWLAIARSHFQEGFMALNRAVFQPQRIALPEDAQHG